MGPKPFSAISSRSRPRSAGSTALARAPRGLRTKHWKVLAPMARAAFPIMWNPPEEDRCAPK